jgi:hypothetical protein
MGPRLRQQVVRSEGLVAGCALSVGGTDGPRGSNSRRVADIAHSQQGSNRIRTEVEGAGVRDERYLAGSKDIIGTKT